MFPPGGSTPSSTSGSFPLVVAGTGKSPHRPLPAQRGWLGLRWLKRTVLLLVLFLFASSALIVAVDGAEGFGGREGSRRDRRDAGPSPQHPQGRRDRSDSTSASSDLSQGVAADGPQVAQLRHGGDPPSPPRRGRLQRDYSVDQPSDGDDAGREDVYDMGERSQLTELSLHLYSAILQVRDHRGVALNNLVFSPYPIVKMLLALQQGASGRTLDELTFLLGSDDDDGRGIGAYIGLPLRVYGGSYDHPPPREPQSRGARLLLAERIYVRPDGNNERLRAFQVEAGRHLGIDVQPCSFASPSHAVRDMNAYVHHKTAGLIQRVASREDLPPHEVPGIAIITAALFQNAAWRVPFRLQRSPGVFYALRRGADEQGEEQIQPDVAFMEVTVDKHMFGFEFVSGGSIEVVRIPFKDPRLAMFLIMPTEYPFSIFTEELIDLGGTLIDDIIDYTAVRQWKETRGRRQRSRKLRIRLPWFRIIPDEEGGIDLLPAMHLLHLKHLTERADFTRLSDRGEGLGVEMWKHACAIDVNSKGIMVSTEAHDDDDDDGSGPDDGRGTSGGSDDSSGDAGDEDSGATSSGSQRSESIFDFIRPFYFQVRFQPFYADHEKRARRGNDVILLTGQIVDAYSAQHQPQ